MIVSFLFVLLFVAFPEFGSFFSRTFNIKMDILIFGVVAGFVFLVFNLCIAILLGYREYDKVNCLNIARSALPLVLTIISSFLFQNSDAFIMTFIASMALVCCVAIYIALKRTGSVRFSKGSKSKAGHIDLLYRYG